MEYNFKDDVKLFMVFDILGDTERTGPLLWQIDRKRLEDVKNHILDLLLIARILKKYFPPHLNFDKIIDYIICHDFPEAITGDITKFEGVSEEEIKRVTNLAICYLIERFNNVLDLKTILNNFENQKDIESKVVRMIDKVHSASTFIKYQTEKNIDMDDPRIISELRNHPFVVKKRAEGKDLADIFYEFHMKAVNITDEECKLYNINREDADNIVNAIKSFASEMYNQKLNGSLLKVKDFFPESAMKYNRNKRSQRMKIIEVKKRTTTLINQLLEVWEDSVKATHLFLSSKEIENIKKYVPQALKEVSLLVIIENGNHVPIAFMGIENQKLEMLFIKNSERGKGLGKQLLNYGIEHYDVNKLVVNEQNPLALGFYEYLGFRTYKRAELDEQGNPYPILYMKLD